MVYKALQILYKNVFHLLKPIVFVNNESQNVSESPKANKKYDDKLLS